MRRFQLVSVAPRFTVLPPPSHVSGLATIDTDDVDSSELCECGESGAACVAGSCCVSHCAHTTLALSAGAVVTSGTVSELETAPPMETGEHAAYDDGDPANLTLVASTTAGEVVVDDPLQTVVPAPPVAEAESDEDDSLQVGGRVADDGLETIIPAQPGASEESDDEGVAADGGLLKTVVPPPPEDLVTGAYEDTRRASVNSRASTVVGGGGRDHAEYE